MPKSEIDTLFAQARPHIEAFYNKFLRMPMEMLLPPGYLSLASLASVGDKARAALQVRHHGHHRH